MRRVIIEHPWGKLEPDKRTEYLRLIIKDCLRKGDSPMCSVPIYVLTGALDDADAVERRAGIDAGLEWYKSAQACIVYRDHGISAGMQDGIDRALCLGIPIEERWLCGKPLSVRMREAGIPPRLEKNPFGY